MFPNPKPAVDAVDRTGALPSFLFSHPIVAGFFAMIMLPVFGAAATIFLLFGDAGTLETFENARGGAMLSMAFGALIFIGILVSAFFCRKKERPASFLCLAACLA